MPELPKSLDHLDRIRIEAAEARLRAIQSQLAAAFTLCGTAETAIRLGQFDEARTVVQKLLYGAEAIRHHLDEPRHVPPASVPNLREQLAKLENTIRNVEQQLGNT